MVLQVSGFHSEEALWMLLTSSFSTFGGVDALI